MPFSIDLPLYSGPVDLLLHIVRREEIALADLSLARIIDQYLEYLDVLVELQVDEVADFLEVASVLVEMKAKQVVPSTEESLDAESQPNFDVSDELVCRLMEYKRIRDAAAILEEQGQLWQQRCSRLTNDLPARNMNMGEQSIEPIEVWDLVSAFGRILRERQPPSSTTVVYDETPIHQYMEQIHRRVATEGRVELTNLFRPGMHKSALVAMFLATLELTRHHGLATEQQDAGQPLYLLAGKRFRSQLEVHQVDNLSADQVLNSNLPVAPR